MKQKPIDILLVDDNPDDVELALYALRRNQLTNHIHVVYDGVEALDFLFCRGEYANRSCANNPKLVLLDLNMPKLNGLEVLKEIRSNDKMAGIPVVILTTSSEERDLIESYRLGVNSYTVVSPKMASRTLKTANLHPGVAHWWTLKHNLI